MWRGENVTECRCISTCTAYGDAVECLTSTRAIRVRSPAGSSPKNLSSLCHLVAQCGSVLGLRAAKGLSRRFWHGSEQIQGTNLIKQVEIVTGRPCGSVA